MYIPDDNTLKNTEGLFPMWVKKQHLNSRENIHYDNEMWLQCDFCQHYDDIFLRKYNRRDCRGGGVQGKNLHPRLTSTNSTKFGLHHYFCFCPLKQKLCSHGALPAAGMVEDLGKWCALVSDEEILLL